jgi:hypothetical protein
MMEGFTPVPITGISPIFRALRCRTGSCREVQDRDTSMYNDVTIRCREECVSRVPSYG